MWWYMPLTFTQGFALTSFALVAGLGLLQEENVKVEAFAPTSSSVALIVSTNGERVLRKEWDCARVNMLSLDEFNEQARISAQSAFTHVSESQRRRRTFDENLRLVAPAAVRQASKICERSLVA